VPIPTPRRQTSNIPDAEPAAPVGGSDEDYASFLRNLARSAGVPGDVFSNQDAAELGETLGALIRMVTENTRQLLDARQQAKRVTRSANQTMIQAQDNNPLKFSPTAEEALRIMFGPRTQGYLDARRAFDQSFADLKSHQLKTFAAMQHAVRLLVADLDPKEIEKNLESSLLGGVFGSRKASLWDAYVEQWQQLTKRHRDGLVDAFMTYFAESYDRGGNGLK
jgi:type VI secretion system protein ImpI